MPENRKESSKLAKRPSWRQSQLSEQDNRTRVKAARPKELVSENRKLTWKAVDFAITRKWECLSVSGCPISTETEFLNSCQVGQITLQCSDVNETNERHLPS